MATAEDIIKALIMGTKYLYTGYVLSIVFPIIIFLYINFDQVLTLFSVFYQSQFILVLSLLYLRLWPCYQHPYD